VNSITKQVAEDLHIKNHAMITFGCFIAFSFNHKVSKH